MASPAKAARRDGGRRLAAARWVPPRGDAGMRLPHSPARAAWLAGRIQGLPRLVYPASLSSVSVLLSSFPTSFSHFGSRSHGYIGFYDLDFHLFHFYPPLCTLYLDDFVRQFTRFFHICAVAVSRLQPAGWASGMTRML